MGNTSEIERILAKKIASWERKVWYHQGSFVVALPKEMMRANMIKKNANCKIIFSHAIDEKSGKVINTFEIVSERSIK